MAATRKYRPWTLKEYQLAVKLRRERYSCEAIGAILGRSATAVHDKLYHGPHSGVPRALMRRAQPVRPEPVALSEQAYRNALPPRDLTAWIMGDPLPGYSALDRRVIGARR